MANDKIPSLAHLGPEFLLWLWWITEREGGTLNLRDYVDGFAGGPGIIDLYVGEKMTMRGVGDERTVARFSTDFASVRPALEAIRTGWLPVEMEMHARREDREYSFTLSGTDLDIKAAKLPPEAIAEEEDGDVYLRFELIDELDHIIRAAFTRFVMCRTSREWPDQLRCLRSWTADGISDVWISGMTSPVDLSVRQPPEQTHQQPRMTITIAPKGEAEASLEVTFTHVKVED